MTSPTKPALVVFISLLVICSLLLMSSCSKHAKKVKGNYIGTLSINDTVMSNNANINILTPKLKREQKAEKGRSKGGTNKAAAEKDIRENHNLKIADYAIKLLNERKCTERELSGIVASSEVVKESNIRKRGLSSKQVREILREFDVLK